MRKASRVILALDVPSRRRALQVAESTYEVVDAIKINYPLVLAAGLEIVGEFAEHTSVICDFKIADIPNTARLIATEAFEAGAEGVIAHAFTGEDSLESVVEVAEDYTGDVYVVTEMSHPGATRFMQPVAEDMARMAVETGATGVVAPATRPERLARIRDMVGDLTIISPGAGAQGGTPAGAIKAGADYVIIGRSIYTAGNPRLSALEAAAEIDQVLE